MRNFILIISVFWTFTNAYSQKRVIDMTDSSPIAAASIFDASGNMVGLTTVEGVLPEIPATVYPITISCIGYEQLVVKSADEKDLAMTPTVYNLAELVVVPVKRNILKQTFYVREYFSMCNSTDTVTFFMEHMANRFVPATKDAKFKGSSSLRILGSNNYSRYQLFGKDSIATDSKSVFPSMLNVYELNKEDVVAPKSFRNSGTVNKLYEKSAKSGMSLIQKQNDQTFIQTEDMLADTKDHKFSPWALKLLGFTMDFKQFYSSHSYRINEKGVYNSNDLVEASFVMEADGRGKYLRKALKSEKPITIRSMVELYVVDCEYLSKEEAKEEYDYKPTRVRFDIPTTVPPLNRATRQLVERAKTEAKTKK